MNIDNRIQHRLERMFPGVIIEPFPYKMHIRTNNWQISSDEMEVLRRMGLVIDSIYTEGDGVITLVLDPVSTQKVLKK